MLGLNGEFVQQSLLDIQTTRPELWGIWDTLKGDEQHRFIVSRLFDKKIPILDNGWIELRDFTGRGGGDLKVVSSARTSYWHENKGEAQDKRLLKYLKRKKHTGPFEFVSFDFRVKCPIFVARQWMRHRTGKYNEHSLRYSEKGISDFYIPDKWRVQSSKDKQMSQAGDPLVDTAKVIESLVESFELWQSLLSDFGLDKYIQVSIVDGWRDDLLTSGKHIKLSDMNLSKVLDTYCQLGHSFYGMARSMDVAREQARFFLPPNLYTMFVFQIDAHNLMHFLKLRMDETAQYETRMYAQAIYNEFFKKMLSWTAEAFEEYG